MSHNDPHDALIILRHVTSCAGGGGGFVASLIVSWFCESKHDFRHGNPFSNPELKCPTPQIEFFTRLPFHFEPQRERNHDQMANNISLLKDRPGWKEVLSGVEA